MALRSVITHSIQTLPRMCRMHFKRCTSRYMYMDVAKGETAMQKYDYFLVLDFEATCDSDENAQPQEIIEFPVLKVNSSTFEIESKFHTYVEPYVNNELTSFCTELTGIIQNMVDGQPVLHEVLEDFHDWMSQNDLLNRETKSIFVTCGDEDLNIMLPQQCTFLGMPTHDYFNRWINLKQAFTDLTKVYPKNMTYMLNYLGLKLKGRLHSGMDDCRNIAQILSALAERGVVFDTIQEKTDYKK